MLPSPQTTVAPLLLAELELLDDALDELDELDDALDELLDDEPLEDALDELLDEPLDDEPDVLPADDALDVLLDEEPSKSDTLVMSMAPSVSKAQASARTLRARANETMVQIVNERD